ncbi:MAG: hypothetical protein AABY15_04860 [Nanoarchaeota archaeon]
MGLYQELEKKREEREEKERKQLLEHQKEILSYFKPLSKIQEGRIISFLEVKTYHNEDKSKIYTRFELMQKMLKENNFNNTLMERPLIKNNLSAESILLGVA